MELSKYERLILINQFKILEALYPNEADHYAKHREAIESGYVLHYAWAFDHLDSELSENGCSEVMDILDMYRAIIFSYRALDNKNDVEDITFIGFDGNNETKQMAYTLYQIFTQGNWAEVKDPYDTNQVDPRRLDFNSHRIMLPQYRAMLDKWSEYDRKSTLSKDEINNILRASQGE